MAPQESDWGHHRSWVPIQGYFHWFCLGLGDSRVTFPRLLSIFMVGMGVHMYACVHALVFVYVGSRAGGSQGLKKESIALLAYSLGQGLSVKLRTHRYSLCPLPVCVGYPVRPCQMLCWLELQAGDPPPTWCLCGFWEPHFGLILGGKHIQPSPQP